MFVVVIVIRFCGYIKYVNLNLKEFGILIKCLLIKGLYFFLGNYFLKYIFVNKYFLFFINYEINFNIIKLVYSIVGKYNYVWWIRFIKIIIEVFICMLFIKYGFRYMYMDK